MNILFVTLAVVVLSTVYASLCEWLLHKYVMHRPLLGFISPYQAHTLTHHRIFKSNASYHLKDPADKPKIRMAWWNGPILVFLALLSISWVIVLPNPWVIFVTAGAVFSLYYVTYEYIHWCMHLPRTRRRVLERFKVFEMLNGHHLLHHRYPAKNLNVVCPLADILFGTHLVRSPVCFAQAFGHSVPNVQPSSCLS